MVNLKIAKVYWSEWCVKTRTKEVETEGFFVFGGEVFKVEGLKLKV
jgi:hypothetical protein